MEVVAWCTRCKRLAKRWDSTLVAGGRLETVECHGETVSRPITYEELDQPAYQTLTVVERSFRGTVFQFKERRQ